MLIADWGTGRPLGVAGAGLATTLASGAGLLALALLFHRMRTPLRLELAQPRPAVWGRIAGIGLPAGGEFLLMFVYMSLVYWIIRPFGSEAQAGFGVGARVMQSVFLPAMAVAFAAGPSRVRTSGPGTRIACARPFAKRRSSAARLCCC